MIHSLAGGDIKKIKVNDFAKVELLEGLSKGGIFWYISKIEDLKEGDIVLVPFGKYDALTKAKVLRVDKAVSSQISPIPTGHAKEVYSKYSPI